MEYKILESKIMGLQNNVENLNKVHDILVRYGANELDRDGKRCGIGDCPVCGKAMYCYPKES